MCQAAKNLILVAYPKSNLPHLCKMLEKNYNISAVCFDCDLTSKKKIEKLTKLISSNYEINMLINNAGIGGTSLFGSCSLNYLDNIIQLNIRATTILTKLLIPILLKEEEAYILNVSSMAAFVPIPFKTIYPASKAFIYSFTRSLSLELENTGIHTAVLAPGPILTNPDVTLRIIRQGWIAKLSLLSTCKIARIALKALYKKKKVIIPGLFNQINWLVTRLIPKEYSEKAMGRIVQKELAKNIF